VTSLIVIPNQHYSQLVSPFTLLSCERNAAGNLVCAEQDQAMSFIIYWTRLQLRL